MKIRIGSRDSKLAVIQSQLLIDSLKKQNPEAQIELITMKTTGDIILDKTLDKIGGKGLFVKELDRALLDKKVDLTVHSFKDMPMNIDEKLPIAAVSSREDPRDVLVLPLGKTELDLSLPIGCSSARRRIQLLNLYPEAQIKSVRGNVQTRLGKLDSGEYSALVLAYAGLKRLNLEERVSRIFEVSEILPSACQGILAVQARQDFDSSCLSSFCDEAAKIASIAERSFVKTLDGGCSSPVAAYCVLEGEEILLTGLYAKESCDDYIICKKRGSKEDAEKIGFELAVEARNAGLPCK